MKKLFLTILILMSFNAHALSWKHDLERTDNTKMTIDEVGGSKVYCGGSSGVYSDSWTIEGAENTSHNLTFTTAGKRYCVVTTYDTEERESAYSSEVSKDYVATIPDSINAKPATDFVVTKVGELRYRVSYNLPTEFSDGKPIHSMTKLYPFEHKDADTSWRGTWQFDVYPISDSFEITVTEGKHYYTTEVETIVNGAEGVGLRSEIFMIDATTPVPLLPPKPPSDVKFDETDILQ